MLNYPDFVVFDLDPYLYSGKEARGEEPELHRRAFGRTRTLALRVREMLGRLGLETWIKTSGRTGLHLYLPIVRSLDFDAAREVAEAIARHARAERPREVTVEWAVERRRGKIFFDYNQNVRGKSLAVPYSPRRHPGGTVATPVSWEELESVYPTDFTLRTVPERLEAGGDPWAGILSGQAGPRPRRSATGGPDDPRPPGPRGGRRPAALPGPAAVDAAHAGDAGGRATGRSGWVYEPKLDGVRVLAHVTGGKVRLLSRNRKPIEGGYPELVEALETAIRGDAVLDGEIVAIDPKTGLSSFARLQQRMQLRDAVRAARTGVAVRLYLFDCLYLRGRGPHRPAAGGPQEGAPRRGLV